MAVIALNGPHLITRNGLDLGTVGGSPTQMQAVAAADTAEIQNDGETFFLVIWGGTGGNLTIVTPLTLGEVGLAVADLVITFTSGQAKWLGPYEGPLYNNLATGKITLDPDQSCSIAAFKVGE
jgi:hypothetical protein